MTFAVLFSHKIRDKKKEPSGSLTIDIIYFSHFTTKAVRLQALFAAILFIELLHSRLRTKIQ